MAPHSQELCRSMRQRRTGCGVNWVIRTPQGGTKAGGETELSFALATWPAMHR